MALPPSRRSTRRRTARRPLRRVARVPQLQARAVLQQLRQPLERVSKISKQVYLNDATLSPRVSLRQERRNILHDNNYARAP